MLQMPNWDFVKVSYIHKLSFKLRGLLRQVLPYSMLNWGQRFRYILGNSRIAFLNNVNMYMYTFVLYTYFKIAKFCKRTNNKCPLCTLSKEFVHVQFVQKWCALFLYHGKNVSAAIGNRSFLPFSYPSPPVYWHSHTIHLKNIGIALLHCNIWCIVTHLNTIYSSTWSNSRKGNQRTTIIEQLINKKCTFLSKNKKPLMVVIKAKLQSKFQNFHIKVKPKCWRQTDR